MEATLKRLVRERLDQDDSLSVEAGLLVLASCEGQEALGSALAAEELPHLTEAPPEKAATGATADAFLGAITVEGFRGIGPRASLPLAPGLGLTLVVGRNGSGKSSFAEAIEILLTGDNLRWRGRVQAWRENWRNLHNAESTEIEASSSSTGSAARPWRGGAGSLAPRWMTREPGRSPRPTTGHAGLARLEGCARLLPSVPLVQRS